MNFKGHREKPILKIFLTEPHSKTKPEENLNLRNMYNPSIDIIDSPVDNLFLTNDPHGNKIESTSNQNPFYQSNSESYYDNKTGMLTYYNTKCSHSIDTLINVHEARNIHRNVCLKSGQSTFNCDQFDAYFG